MFKRPTRKTTLIGMIAAIAVVAVPTLASAQQAYAPHGGDYDQGYDRGGDGWRQGPPPPPPSDRGDWHDGGWHDGGDRGPGWGQDGGPGWNDDRGWHDRFGNWHLADGRWRDVWGHWHGHRSSRWNYPPQDQPQWNGGWNRY